MGYAKSFQIRNISRKPLKFTYEVPERYQNAFYLANASFFDSTNWFLHKAYESVFPTLKNDLKTTMGGKELDETTTHCKLENIVEVLDQCNSIIDVRFPVKRDNGRYEIVRGFRAQYGQMVGSDACLGGLRILDSLTRDHMKGLSVLCAIKNSCMGIGMAGAHGGIKINPKNYSRNELKNIVELYVAELHKKGYCNLKDIILPDINTSEVEMDWISKYLETRSGQDFHVCAVGKSLSHGGIEGFQKTAAYGASKALDIFLEDEKLMTKIGLSKGLEGKRFIIQGLGKVGLPLAQMLIERGAICVGVREMEAYIHDKNGINFKELLDYRAQKGTIENFGLSRTEYPDSIFTEDCDILILAACHKSLVCYIAKDVKAKVILEASDGPITPSADKIFTTKSKLVIPDIYAIGGSTIASYFEYLRNLEQIGVLDDNFFRYSNKLYSKILKNLSQDFKQRISVGSQVQNVDNCSPLYFSAIKSFIDCIFVDVAKELVEKLHDQKIGLDLRNAAYSLAIRNSFKNIFSQKKFL